ncbi:hypothetical protein HHK36_029727 [Tetracentron sinense]|uniref:Cytochrome P450 n=1 Tax=Tetracentron sinense TaxID=13715 RepID=A0A835D2V9_TETSI|nr:hypothetical protein HHK36_029727 [Tetracentron sinense]
MESAMAWWLSLVVGVLPIVVWLLWSWNELWFLAPLKARSSATKVPPGHMGFPFFGEMLTFLWYFKILGRPDDFIKSKQDRYGDGVGMYRTHLFGSPSIIACSPAINKLILQSTELFPICWPTIELVGHNALVAVHGKSHARLRSYVSNAINQPEALKRIALHVQPHIVSALRSWPDKGTVRVSDEVKKITFANIGKFFISFEPGPILDTLDQNFEGLLKGIRAQPFNFPGTAYHHALQCRKKLMEIFGTELEIRKQNGNGSEARNDLMDGLIHMKDEEGKKLRDEEVLDNIASLIIAGYKSTALASMWAIYYLAKFPDVLRKLREENMAVCKNEKGDFINFENISQMKYTNKEPPKPGTYQVFGGGPRICAGNMLARIQVAILLHHLAIGYKNPVSQFPPSSLLTFLIVCVFMANQLVSSTMNTTPLLPHSSMANMLSIKLNGNNYLLWRNQILPLLESQELLGFIDGTAQQPLATITQEDGTQVINPEHRKWRLTDRFVLSLINSSLTEAAMSMTMDRQNAFEVWTVLEESYAHKSNNRELQLREELQVLKRDSSSISDHVRKFRAICDQLSAIGSPVPDTDKVYWFLRGLGPEYHTFVTTTLSKPPIPSFQEVVPSLLSHELLLRSLSPVPTGHEYAFNVQRGGRHGRNNNRGGGRNYKPNHRNQNYHNSGIGKQQGEHQFVTNPRSNNDNRGGQNYHRSNQPYDDNCGGPNYHRSNQPYDGRNQASANHDQRSLIPGTQPIANDCQICGRGGHTALECRNRFNHSHQTPVAEAFTSLTIQDTQDAEWYPDSGATAHMTNNEGKENRESVGDRE